MSSDLLGTGDAESSSSSTAIFAITKKKSLQSLNHACYMNGATRYRGENSRHRAIVKPCKPNQKVSSEILWTLVHDLAQATLNYEFQT